MAKLPAAHLTTSQRKTAWLTKANPYKQPYMWDAFREGARAYWAARQGTATPLNRRERTAYWKGYRAAERDWGPASQLIVVDEGLPEDAGYYVPAGQTDPA